MEKGNRLNAEFKGLEGSVPVSPSKAKIHGLPLRGDTLVSGKLERSNWIVAVWTIIWMHGEHPQLPKVGMDLTANAVLSFQSFAVLCCVCICVHSDALASMCASRVSTLGVIPQEPATFFEIVSHSFTRNFQFS